MMEWHTRTTRGRFLEEWASPAALAALAQVFARYDEEDVWRALQATMDLFHELAVETAASLKYAYPSLGEEKARGWVDEMYFGRKRKSSAG